MVQVRVHRYDIHYFAWNLPCGCILEWKHLFLQTFFRTLFGILCQVNPIKLLIVQPYGNPYTWCTLHCPIPCRFWSCAPLPCQLLPVPLPTNCITGLPLKTTLRVVCVRPAGHQHCTIFNLFCKFTCSTVKNRRIFWIFYKDVLYSTLRCRFLRVFAGALIYQCRPCECSRGHESPYICRRSDSTVSEDAGIEPMTVVTSALAVRRSNRSARSRQL